MAKRNDYWRRRMEALTQSEFRNAEAIYQDIQEQYRRALNDIQMDMEVWYQRLADNNGISYAAAKRFLKAKELEEFKWTVEQYIKAGVENSVNGKWIKELENASAAYHISRLEALKLQMQQHAELLTAQLEGRTTEYLQRAYGRQYYHTAYEIAVGTGVGSNLAALGTSTINLVLARPWAQDGKAFSSRIWDNKEKLVRNLHTELTQCIIRGEAPKKAIDRLAKVMNVSRSQAGALIMTETAAISAEAHRQCYKDLDVEEFEVVETLDKHTCGLCQDMDGKHYPMSDYRIGETVPPFHPRCRGCTCPYFDDEFSEGAQRIARDPDTGNTYYVPADMTYKEWKSRYVMDVEQMPIKSFLGKDLGSQAYRPILRGESSFAEIKPNQTVRIQRISSYPDDVYISDGADIKPRALHTINLNTQRALKQWGIPLERKPRIVIVSPDEMPTAYGKYDAVTNTVYYIPQVADAKAVGALGDVEFHEMWHMKQAEDFRKKFGDITRENYGKYMKYTCGRAKKKIDGIGVTEYNVSEISEYAFYKYVEGRYDEVEAEYQMSRRK